MKKEQSTNEFSYTYSAEEQAEIKRIRDKYAPPTESTDAMERLRRLDTGVTQTAQTVSLIFGIVGALLLGFGMSLIMTDLGSSLGVLSYVFGILLGLIGGTLAGLAYPIYNAILTAKRKKIAPEIIRLTDELMK